MKTILNTKNLGLLTCTLALSGCASAPNYTLPTHYQGPTATIGRVVMQPINWKRTLLFATKQSTDIYWVKNETCSAAHELSSYHSTPIPANILTTIVSRYTFSSLGRDQLCYPLAMTFTPKPNQHYFVGISLNGGQCHYGLYQSKSTHPSTKALHKVSYLPRNYLRSGAFSMSGSCPESLADAEAHIHLSGHEKPASVAQKHQPKALRPGKTK